MGVSMGKHVYLESDGKLLLVYNDGSGPAIPKMGRVDHDSDTELIRLPTEEELSNHKEFLKKNLKKNYF